MSPNIDLLSDKVFKKLVNMLIKDQSVAWIQNTFNSKFQRNTYVHNIVF